jgi:HK97 family phage major capsid protein
MDKTPEEIVREGFDELTRRMDARLDEMETVFNRGQLGSGRRKSTKDDELIKGLNAYIRTGASNSMLTEGNDPGAGYLVPSPIQPSMTESLYSPPTLLGLVRTERWDGPGDSWIEPKKRSLLRARRRGGETEAAQDTSNADPFGLLKVPADESECLIELSQKLLDDVDRDLSSMVIVDSNNAFDQQLDAEIVSGSGAGNEAQGFLTLPSVATEDASRPWGQIQFLPSGAAATITADGLVDLVYSLRSPYRAAASWVMSSTTAAVVSKLKSGDGTYLWSNSLVAGQPPSLLGYPVFTDDNMPAVGAGAFPIAFANWKLAYIATKKNATRFLRDPYTKKPNVQIYAYKRQGGGVGNSEAIKLLKISAT